MDAISFAQRTRDFLCTLFGSKLVLQLRLEIADLKVERDYFRGRVERLEMARDLSEQQKRVAAVPRKEHDLSPVGGRKTWPQIQREHREKVREALKAEQESKSKEKQTLQ